MSVAQVKKRFGEMESYLGRDREALRRLKLLKDDVNVLRTSLAAAEEKAEQAEVVKNAARGRADEAELRAKEAESKIKMLEDRLVALSSKVRLHEAISQKEGDSDPDECDQTGVNNDDAEAKKLMKALRRRLPQCPLLTSKQSERHCPAFIRQAFSKGWSHQDIWILGASVAVIAAHEGGVTIVDPVGTDFGGSDKKITEGMGGAFMRWFMRNFKQTDPSVRKRTVFFGNSRPAELIDPNKAEMTEAFLSVAE